MRPELKREALDGLRVLRGGSMSPFLRDGDLVAIEPLAAGEGRVGDVVAFSAGGDETVVVHRVVRIVDGGLVTRGDSTRAEDLGVVTAGRLIGRVVVARRGGRVFAVPGGRRGRVRGAVARARGAAPRAAARVASPLSPLLGAGWAAGLLPAAARPRVVSYEAGGRVERRVLLGGRVAGRFDDAGGGWRIRIRYRPFVRTGDLPRA